MGIARRSSTTTAPAASEYASGREEDDDLAPEDEETPKRSSSVTRRGWGAAKKTMEKHASGSYADDWTPPTGETLVKFLEDDPFFSAGQHWIDEIKEGKRGFYCLDDDCPLCGVGHKARPLMFFNVAVIGESGTTPEVKALKAGPMLADLIKDAHEGRGGPLGRHFWVLKKTVTGGTKKKTTYGIDLVKARDLVEDFEVDPDEIVASLAKVKPYTEDIFTLPTVAELKEVVQEHLLDD